jgi:hypothetical membrane protein
MTRSFKIQRILPLIAIIGVSYFGLVILLLTFFDSEFNPITEAASDYGVGHFAIAMNLGFFVAGVGFVAFALSYARQKMQRKSKASSILLIIAGLVLMMDSVFTTNLPGGAPSLHGTIHGFGGFFFFITAPIGALLISRKQGRLEFLITLVALIIGFVILGAPINAAGLAERVVLLVIFSSIIINSVRLYRGSRIAKILSKGP